MWDLSRQGLEPVSPALAGVFLTTVPPGKSLPTSFYFLNVGYLEILNYVCGSRYVSIKWSWCSPTTKFYSWEKWSTERLMNLLKVTQRHASMDLWRWAVSQAYRQNSMSHSDGKENILQLGALWWPSWVGWGWMGGRAKREGLYVYIELIHFIVQQKLTQHCKAIILQF